MRRLVTFVVGLAALMLLLTVPAAAADGDSIVGVWLTEGGASRVEITKSAERYSGRVIWLNEPNYPSDDEKGMAGQPMVDRENPDPARRQQPVVGLQIMSGFVYRGHGQWARGTIYDPESGKTYKCKVSLGEDGVLRVRGFIGFSMLGRTTEWARATSELAPTDADTEEEGS